MKTRTTLELSLGHKDEKGVLIKKEITVDMSQDDAHRFYIGKTFLEGNKSYIIKKVETINIETI